ncbi:hypothetical protein GGR55DRAFT_95314 [Xylaria sp. FL0064]|nr:hypothetical protein GGR55DRAFT_95314 [Xylaria sp. FL0064]
MLIMINGIGLAETGQPVVLPSQKHKEHELSPPEDYFCGWCSFHHSHKELTNPNGLSAAMDYGSKRPRRFPPVVLSYPNNLKTLFPIIGLRRVQIKNCGGVRRDTERQMPRPKSSHATPDAGNEGPGSGTPRKRVTRPDSVDENTGRDSAQKRRRRAFSCQSCQRLKCRCEYDPGAQGCHRCQTLRRVSIR